MAEWRWGVVPPAIDASPYTFGSRSRSLDACSLQRDDPLNKIVNAIISAYHTSTIEAILHWAIFDAFQIYVAKIWYGWLLSRFPDGELEANNIGTHSLALHS